MKTIRWIALLGLGVSLCGCKDEDGDGGGSSEGGAAQLLQDKQRELMKKRTEIFRELTSKQRELATVQREVQNLELQMKKEAERELAKADERITNPVRDAPVTRQSVARAEAYVTGLKDISGIVKKEYEFWKRASRKSMVGLSVGNLPLPDGSTLTEAKIVSIEEDAVTFSHSRGETAVEMEQLPEELRNRIVDESFVATF